MNYLDWENLDEEIEQVIRETFELYQEGDSFLNISPRSGLVESTNGPRHNSPISVPFSMVLKKNLETGEIMINYSTIHEMIHHLDIEDD